MASVKKQLTIGDIVNKLANLKANQLLYGALLVAVFLLGYLFAKVQTSENNGNLVQNPIQQVAPEGAPEGSEVVQIENGALPVVGEEGAQVAVVEFSDFECPFCKRYFDETLGQIKSDYVDSGQVKLYYRHFPLDFHPAAQPAALASECANEQGAFWEYHDKVFAEQERITGGGEVANTALKAMATEIGLNAAQFNSCFDSEKYQANVDKDLADGQAAGVSGTPTIFINGRKIVGAQPYSVFKAIIDEELNS